MRSFLYPMFLLFFILVCCPLAAAQEKTEHELFWNGSAFSKSRNADAEIPPKFREPISVDDFIAIRGKYYDDDKGPIAIFVSVTDVDGNVITKYLAQIFDESDIPSLKNGKDLILFGPQFYDGYEIMKMKFTIFRLGETKAQKVFGQVKKYLPVIPTFIPGANLTNPYTELAMQLMSELIEKDKNKNKVAEFELSLRGLDDKAAIPQKWYVFGQGSVAKLIDAETSFDKDSTLDIPILPAGMKKDGAALLVGALRKTPDTSYRELLDRLKRVSTSVREDVRSKIPIPSIATGDAQADQLMLDHIWFSIFAKLRFATDQKKLQEIIKGFFRNIETLSQLTKDGPPTGALIKMSDEKERLLTQQLIGVFGYRIGGQDLTDNMKKPAIFFTTLEQWRNWFNHRCDLMERKGQDDKLCSFFDWKTANQQQAPYLIATDRYILNKAEDVKKSLNDKVADKTGDDRLLSASEIKEILPRVLQFFQDQPEEPWMFFEQVAVARWIKKNFGLKKEGATGDDLPEVPLEPEPKQLRDFVAALRTAIANTKLLKADGDRYVAYPMENYVWSELFLKKLVEIQGKDQFQVNQHVLLKQAYNSTIGKFWGQLSEEEKGRIKEKFKALINDKDLQAEYAKNESAVFFDKYLLKVTSDVQPISSTDPELLASLAFYDSYLTDPDRFFSQATRENREFKNYLENTKSVADFSRKFISSSGRPLSVRQRAVTFLQDKLVKSLLEDSKLKLIPQNSKEASEWHTEFATTFLDGKTWDRNCKCFGGDGSEPEQLEALKKIENKFSKFTETNATTPQLKEILRETLEFLFPPPKEHKPLRVTSEAIRLLEQFTGLNLIARPDLKEEKEPWEQTFLAEPVRLNIKKCQIGGTEKNIIVVRGQPCPGASVPSPASQPSS